MKSYFRFSINEKFLLEKPYQIYGPDPHGPSDSESRPLGKPYKNKKRAKTRADKLDQEIGGYRHFVRKVEEAKEPKPVSHSLKKMSRAYSKKTPGVNVDATERKSGDIRLHNIFIPTSERNKGIGTRAMKGLTAIADKSKKRITLSQAPEKGKKKKLNDFYKSHGFEANKGRSRDLSVSDTHIRNPKVKE